MNTKALSLAAAISMVLVPASGVQAQTVLGGDHSIDGSLCVGAACTGAESDMSSLTFKLKEPTLAMVFQDTSTGAFTTNDWRLLANEATSYGLPSFSVEDAETGNQVLRVMAGAPASALSVGTQGDIGFGTVNPQAELHIVDGTWPRIRLEQDGSEGQPSSVWDLGIDTDAFYLVRVSPQPNGTPFVVDGLAPSHSLSIDHDGDVGFGLNNPGAPIHIRRDNGSALLRVEEDSVQPGPRTLVNLENNGRPEIVLANTATGSEWSFGAGTNFILKQGPFHSETFNKTKLFEITPSGDATLVGTLTTGGTNCGGGCDFVFSPDYQPPSIKDHAKAMYALGYLPNIGPTPENAPINVSDKLGRMLNELEHAHIYIDQLNQQLTEQNQFNQTLLARLMALETMLEN